MKAKIVKLCLFCKACRQIRGKVEKYCPTCRHNLWLPRELCDCGRCQKFRAGVKAELTGVAK